jgi:hypothetical protein
MTTDEAHEDKERIPEHAPRLDWMRFAPEVSKAMIRLDTAARQGVEPTCRAPAERPTHLLRPYQHTSASRRET